MKYILLALFCSIGISASAQLNLFKKKFVRPESVELVCRSEAHYRAVKLPVAKITSITFDPSDYAIEAQEAIVMKQAQHNMRFRVYHEASLNFTDLAHLYVQEKKTDWPSANFAITALQTNRLPLVR